MVVMKDRSRDQISVIDGNEGVACDLHGRSWTGEPIGTNEKTGEVAVFQYVHPDYEQVTEPDTIKFAGEKICTDCGGPTEPMPLWVADRILKAHPRLAFDCGHTFAGICHECADYRSRPSPVDEEDEDEENGRGF